MPANFGAVTRSAFLNAVALICQHICGQLQSDVHSWEQMADPLSLLYHTMHAYSGACLFRSSRRLTRNKRKVCRAQRLDVHSREAVEEGLGQAAAAAALLDGVLRCKAAGAGRAGKGLGQLGDVHLGSVVQQGIQALQNALTCRQHTTKSCLQAS